MEVSFGVYPNKDDDSDDKEEAGEESEEAEEETEEESEDDELYKNVEKELARLRKEKSGKGKGKKSEKAAARVSTGISGLDKIMSGGYPSGSIITLNGEAGSGKSTFGMQFLIDGINNGENVLYVSLEEHKIASLRHMKSFGWDLQELESQGRFMFLEFPVDEIETLVLKDDVIRKMILQSGITRVLIDPITVFALMYNTGLERRRALIKLIERVRGWNTTTMFIEEDSGYWESDRVPRSVSGVESLTEGYIYLWYRLNEAAHARERYIEIIKMRGVEYGNKLYPFSITNNGVELLGVGAQKQKPEQNPAPKPKPEGSKPKPEKQDNPKPKLKPKK